MEAPATYDLSDCIVSVGGVPLSGAGTGSFVEISQASDTWAIAEGVDGSTAAAHSNSKLFDVKIVLLGTSKLNAYLSSVHVGKLKPKILIADPNGNDLFVAPTLLVVKAATWKLSNKVEDREWTCKALGGLLFVGGVL